MASVFDNIKKILEKEEMCVVSRNKTPRYVAMTWNRYERLKQDMGELVQLREEAHNARASEQEYSVDLTGVVPEEDVPHDVDINSIPV